MKTKSLLLGAATFVSLGASAPAQANHLDGWYFGLEGGANWVQDAEGQLVTAGGVVTSGTDEFDAGWIALAAFGYGMNHWRLELEGAYRNNETTAGVAELSEWSLMLNILYDIHLAKNFGLTLGAGAGGDYANLELTTTSYDDGEWNFAAQAIAGLTYALTDRWDLTLTYRYLRVFDPSFDGLSYYSSPSLFPAILEYDDFSKHAVTIGLRYGFGHAEPAPPPPPPPQAEAPPPPPEMPREYIVFFGHNQSDLTSEAADVVRQAAAAAKQYGSATISVVGHADRSGSTKYNEKLSVKRATNVKSALMSEGIAEGAITVSGKGESDPLVPTADGVREPQNRRVHISL